MYTLMTLPMVRFYDMYAYIYIYIYYILKTLTRHRRTSMLFEIWALWGDARIFALFAPLRPGVWVSGLVAACLDFGSCRGRFCYPGVDFGVPGPTF